MKEKVPLYFYYESFLMIITYFETEHKSDFKNATLKSMLRCWCFPVVKDSPDNIRQNSLSKTLTEF